MGGLKYGSNRGRGRPKGSRYESTVGKEEQKEVVPFDEKTERKPYTVSEKALAQRRKNAENMKVKPLQGAEADYNAMNIAHVLSVHEIATHADRTDPVSLRSCFLNYLALCQQDGFKPGTIGACAAMGVNTGMLSYWAKCDNEGFRELSAFVRSVCSILRESMIADSKINPVIGIFWQRNYDGLRNDTEQVQAVQEYENDEKKTANDYKKKYGKLLEE